MSNSNVIAKIPVPGGQSRKKWQILTGGAIKALGLILMVLDHLHQMFINQGAPGWLYWFGRPVAALFLFLCAEGFYYTRSKKIYLLRFLAAFILMNAVNLLVTKFLYIEDVALINNMFGTLFMSAFYMLIIDLFREGFREKKAGCMLLAIGGGLLPLMAGLGLLLLITGKNSLNGAVFLLVYLIPTPFSVEGGFLLVITGVLFYVLRKFRWAQALVPAAAALFVIATSRGETGIPDPQWLMLFAAIPILLYNGQRGRGGKYFFYAFYPAHIYLFYFIAFLIGRVGR
jgi:hypothetical protein